MNVIVELELVERRQLVSASGSLTGTNQFILLICFSVFLVYEKPQKAKRKRKRNAAKNFGGQVMLESS